MGKPPIKTIIDKYGSEENYKNYLHQKLSGKHFWTNGIDDLKFYDDETPPEGWWRGRTNSGKGTKDYKFINNGIDQTQIPKDQPVPLGWQLGALPLSEEHKENIAAALKKYERTEEHNIKLKVAHNTDTYKENIKNTVQKKYGVDCVFQAAAIKEKIKQTHLDKYGVEFASSSQVVRKKVKETCQERYGVEAACLLEQCRSAPSNNSSYNRNFAELLTNNNISFEREFVIKNKSYDFKVENTLIEINPFATHNSTWGIHTKSGLPSAYHKEKTELAIANNYKCLNIWDWDDLTKVLQALKPKAINYARKCIIKEITEKDTNLFLNSYHFQNTCRGQKIRLGLYYNDELISIMTFGAPRYNQQYEYELLRYCSTKKVVGGANKLFKYFIKTYNPKSIVSYCDESKFRGDLYLNLGFKLISKGIPSKHWYNPKTKQHITDNLLRQRGFDQLFNTTYGKGTSNEQLMLEHGFVEIYDCGQATYIYNY